MTTSAIPVLTEFILARHGETEWNTRGVMQGHLDSPLTRTGVEQAHILGRRIARIQPAHIYASDLGRAHETAKIIAQYYPKPIALEPGLREKNVGVFQGYDWPTIKAAFADIYGEFAQADPDYVIPDGESYNQFMHRVTTTLAQIAARHPGEQILIVSHGGMVSALLRHILGIPLSAPRRYRLKNTSITRITLDHDGQWFLDTFGDTSHLEGMVASHDDIV
jgi:2,3-bisphosphoglycerate-dependent phosphoglycerate mutase